MRRPDAPGSEQIVVLRPQLVDGLGDALEVVRHDAHLGQPDTLSGRTQDRRRDVLSLWLNEQGIRLAEVRVVPDDLQRIAETVNELRAEHDYLFTTGGIGPTHDDITVDAMAAAFGVPAVVHPAARRILEDYYRDRPGGLTEARLRMARVPDGAELIENPSSGAPGIKIENVFILAGGRTSRPAMLEALTGRLEGGGRSFRSPWARGQPKATSPTCCARPRPLTPASRSAAIPSSRMGDTARIS